MRNPMSVFLAVGVLLSLPAAARQRPNAGVGSAIALEYSVQHDVLRPAEDVALLLCLTNQNPRSTRDVAPGDSFAFAFGEGVVHDCADVSVYSPDATMASGDFECEVDGGIVRFRFAGARAIPWPFGDAICSLVTYTTGDRPSTVITSMDVVNQGAFLAPNLPALLLSVGPGLGTPGPPGPQGPSGTAGPSTVGARAFAVSTGMVEADSFGPPIAIPGLDVTIDVAAGSNIEVQVDVLAWHCRPGGSSPDGDAENTAIVVELDGVAVAWRGAAFWFSRTYVEQGPGDPLSITWASPPQAAGPHRVQVLAWYNQSEGGRRVTGCVGSADNDVAQARLLVKELPARP